MNSRLKQEGVSFMSYVPLYIIGFFLRVGIWYLGPDLSDRVELSTPLNSHKRLVEGAVMSEMGYDPYSGVIVHETPLVLRAYLFIQDKIACLELFYILMDLLTAFFLQWNALIVAKDLFKREKAKKIHAEARDIALSEESLLHIPKYTAIGFLFNPYVIANCVAKTTTTFHNLVLSLVILSMSKKKRILGSLFLALSAYLNLYTVMLFVPLALSLSKGSSLFKELIKTGIIFLCFLGALLVWSLQVSGPQFINSVYGFILTVPELTPNMGLFWYFFTEMFEHFRLFFICTFQVNVFIYLLPLSIKLRNEPYLLVLTLLSLISIFKSYPSYGDVGFYLSLLAASTHLIPFMKQTFFVANMLLVTTVLGPILFQLWIYNGSANANYFFAINLVFGTAQIFLVTDVLFAQVKREFFLENGFTQKNEKGEVELTKLKLNSSF